MVVRRCTRTRTPPGCVVLDFQVCLVNAQANGMMSSRPRSSPYLVGTIDKRRDRHGSLWRRTARCVSPLACRRDVQHHNLTSGNCKATNNHATNDKMLALHVLLILPMPMENVNNHHTPPTDEAFLNHPFDVLVKYLSISSIPIQSSNVNLASQPISHQRRSSLSYHYPIPLSPRSAESFIP